MMGHNFALEVDCEARNQRFLPLAEVWLGSVKNLAHL